MNPSSSIQIIGNLCVGLAALIFVLPLQLMLFEVLNKRGGQTDHGAGFFVIAGILLAMWLFLLVGVVCVIASGGLDGLQLARAWFYPLAFGATLAMLALSLLIFEFPNHPNFFTRWIGRVPFYVFPVATMLFTVLVLNPRFTASFPLAPYKLTWLICAGLSLALCGGYLGYRFAVPVMGRALNFGNFLAHRGAMDRESLGKIATLDPQRVFADLLRYANQYQSQTVREAATIRLRSHPDFLDALTAILNSRSPECGLDFLPSATLPPDEQKHLALPRPAPRLNASSKILGAVRILSCFPINLSNT
ncbi:MAG: hypothetical protein QM813_01590, partial [Verrucomicrobiota bacterium]